MTREALEQPLLLLAPHVNAGEPTRRSILAKCGAVQRARVTYWRIIMARMHKQRCEGRLALSFRRLRRGKNLGKIAPWPVGRGKLIEAVSELFGLGWRPRTDRNRFRTRDTSETCGLSLSKVMSKRFLP